MIQDHYLSVYLKLNRLGWSSKRAVFQALLRGESPGEIERKILEENFADALDFWTGRNPAFDPDKEAEECARKKISLISWSDPRYPSVLRRISQPPLVLYVLGELSESDAAAVAVVGTRHPSFYGSTQTRRFTRVLSEKGLTIVSGFARGVDQIAHEAALEVPYGRTLAVLGSGLDKIYPPGNERLVRNIAERGAVISEYPLGTPPLAHHFPERNRIIAGLSLAVLVMEAHYRSGALITAHEAADEGKDVFAVPGPVDQLTSRGTHRLIKEGAALAETPEDVLETVLPQCKHQLPVQRELFWQCDETVGAKSRTVQIPQPERFTESEKNVISLLRDGFVKCEELLERFQGPPQECLNLLTGLELKGALTRGLDGGYRVRAGSCSETAL